MANLDPGGPAEQRPAVDLWRLPEVLDMRVRRRHFDPPRRVTVEGKDIEARDAVEVEVRVAEPFTIRALGPVLWVGDEPLTVADSDGARVYRFFEFRPEALRAGALIALAWNSPGAPRAATRFRYEPPPG